MDHHSLGKYCKSRSTGSTPSTRAFCKNRLPVTTRPLTYSSQAVQLPPSDPNKATPLIKRGPQTPFLCLSSLQGGTLRSRSKILHLERLLTRQRPRYDLSPKAKMLSVSVDWEEVAEAVEIWQKVDMVMQQSLSDDTDAESWASRCNTLVADGSGQPALCQPGGDGKGLSVCARGCIQLLDLSALYGHTWVIL